MLCSHPGEACLDSNSLQDTVPGGARICNHALVHLGAALNTSMHFEYFPVEGALSEYLELELDVENDLCVFLFLFGYGHEF